MSQRLTINITDRTLVVSAVNPSTTVLPDFFQGDLFGIEIQFVEFINQ